MGRENESDNFSRGQYKKDRGSRDYLIEERRRRTIRGVFQCGI